jgi:hypothetical protein
MSQYRDLSQHLAPGEIQDLLALVKHRGWTPFRKLLRRLVADVNIRESKDWPDFNRRLGQVKGLELLDETLDALYNTKEGLEKDAEDKPSGAATERARIINITGPEHPTDAGYADDLDFRPAGPSY